MTPFHPIFRKFCVALSVGFSALASAAPVQIDFGTLVMTGNAGFRSVLANAGVIPTNTSPLGVVQGSFIYDDATSGSTNAAGVVRTYNSAVDALSFSVDGWFSQTLTNIGNNGDIVVRRNSGGSYQVDSITVTVTCAPILNNTTIPTCTSSPGNFSYSFTDPTTNTQWVLDRFTLLLQENVANSNVLNDLALPSSAVWLTPDWTLERVTLRFNPFGADLNNANVNGTIDFLAVTEPSGLALMGVALIGLAAARRRRAG